MDFRVLALIGSGLVASCFIAGAQTTPFYIKGDLGGTLTEDTHLNEFFGPVAPGSKVTFDPGFRLGVTGGYQITEWLSAEANTGFLGSKVRSITDASTLRDVYLSNVPLQAGLRLQYPYWRTIVPYIGGSAGGSVSILDVDHLVVGDTSIHGSEGDVVFAWQAFAGVRYDINPHMGVSVEYHYLADNDSDWTASHVTGVATDHLRFGGVDVHAITAAFEFRF